MSNLIITAICEKVRLQKLRKAKYSILASILHIFQKIFLTELHTYLYKKTLFKSHDFLISCFESGHIFQEKVNFWKINFVILFLSFLNNILTIFLCFLSFFELPYSDKSSLSFWKYVKNKGKAALYIYLDFADVSSLTFKLSVWKRGCTISFELQMPQTSSTPLWKALVKFYQGKLKLQFLLFLLVNCYNFSINYVVLTYKKILVT